MDLGNDPVDDDAVKLAAGVVAAMDGWTQVALSAATGIPQGRLSAIRRNYRDEQCTVAEAAKIEDAVGLPRGYIYGFAGLVSAEGARRGAEAAAKFARTRKRK